MAEREMTAVEMAAIHAYQNDLHDMTPKQVEDEIDRSQRVIEEEEPWLEALVAWQRYTAALRATDEGKTATPSVTEEEAGK